MKRHHLPLLLIILTLWSSTIATKQVQSQQQKEAPSSQTNQVNSDGSFHFEYENKDQGAHYHKSTGNVVKVRGRFGSRSPANGRIDEVVYTSGPRGFRARGANIHRKQNLSQNRRSSPANPSNPNDPLADPSDDPSYAFQLQSKNHVRREEADSSGRVQGQYLYVDDAGDKHGVNYKAGANEGYRVENGVPDQPGTLNYNSPLYKTDPTARGKISYERGPDREYKFITTSPDQRRAEVTGPDGITRGSYSYLDDQGVQRTVQYIAGAGIGYKVVSSTVGPGTHISANSDVPEYSIKAVSNEIAISSEPSGPSSYPHTGPSGPPSGYYPTTSTPSPPYVTPTTTATPYVPTTPSPYPPSAFSGVTPPYYSTPRPFSRPTPEYIQVSTPSTIGGIDRYNNNNNNNNQNNYGTSASSQSLPSGGPSPLSPSGTSSENHNDLIYGLLPPKEEAYFTKQYIPPTPTIPTEVHITPALHTYLPTHSPPLPPPTLSIPPSIVYQTPSYLPTNPSPSPNYLPTSPSQSPYSYIPTVPTIAANYQTIPPQSIVGDAPVRNNAQWFYGLAPGAGKRAHIQNIDLVPYHERALSPSEALRRDEEREAYHRHQRHQQQNHHHHHQPRSLL